MDTGINKLRTLAQAIECFADPHNAHELMVQIRWPGGEICCPNCGSLRVRYIQTCRQWESASNTPKPILPQNRHNHGGKPAGAEGLACGYLA